MGSWNGRYKWRWRSYEGRPEALGVEGGVAGAAEVMHVQLDAVLIYLFLLAALVEGNGVHHCVNSFDRDMRLFSLHDHSVAL